MTDDLIKLARRAVACKGFRWLPGMRTVDAMRVIHDPDRWPDRPCAIREGGWVDTAPPRPLGDDLPDLTDPATIGCLLALVREAWGQPEMCCQRSIAPGLGVYLALVREAWGQDDLGASRYRERWCVEVTPPEGLHYVYGASEAEALAAALEGAP